MDVVNKLIEAIKSSKNIILLGHVGPDGDTLGSTLAIKKIIELAEFESIKKIDMALSGKIPDVYKFLPDIFSIKNIDDKSLLKNYDLAIAMDCGNIDRLGETKEIFKKAKKTANIDHHYMSNTSFADINWVEDAASTGQIIYKLIKYLDIKPDKDIATDLYTSILTDTGGFKFDNTKPETFKVCAEIIEYGADPEYIYKKCYESKPLAMVKLHAKAIDKAMFLENNKIAYTAITRKLLDSLQATDDYTDGISEALRQINGVEIAIIFKETPKGDTKISFRSNGISACDIAKHFDGGGHRLAAGCTIRKGINASIDDVISIVKQELKKIKK